MNEDKQEILRRRAKTLLETRRGLDLEMKEIGNRRNEVMAELRQIEDELVNAFPISGTIYIGGGRG